MNDFKQLYLESWTILYEKFYKNGIIFYNNTNITTNFELFNQFSINVNIKNIKQVLEEIKNL